MDQHARRGCGHPDFGWSLQQAKPSPRAAQWCGHPDFGWSLQHTTRAAFRPAGAATRILGGHCNMILDEFEGEEGEATWISGGHCNMSSGACSLPPVRPPGFRVVTTRCNRACCRSRRSGHVSNTRPRFPYPASCVSFLHLQQGFAPYVSQQRTAAIP